MIKEVNFKDGPLDGKSMVIEGDREYKMLMKEGEDIYDIVYLETMEPGIFLLYSKTRNEYLSPKTIIGRIEAIEAIKSRLFSLDESTLSKLLGEIYGKQAHVVAEVEESEEYFKTLAKFGLEKFIL